MGIRSKNELFFGLSQLFFIFVSELHNRKNRFRFSFGLSETNLLPFVIIILLCYNKGVQL